MSAREPLPDRRSLWTQSVSIGGQRVYLSVGEYPDRRPGEIWLVVAKAGSFLRGSLDNLARMTSTALQCGTPLEEVVKSLRGLNYPPNGLVVGSPFFFGCLSVSDWVAKELEYAYITSRQTPPGKTFDGTEKGSGV